MQHGVTVEDYANYQRARLPRTSYNRDQDVDHAMKFSLDARVIGQQRVICQWIIRSTKVVAEPLRNLSSSRFSERQTLEHHLTRRKRFDPARELCTQWRQLAGPAIMCPNAFQRKRVVSSSA